MFGRYLSRLRRGGKNGRLASGFRQERVTSAFEVVASLRTDPGCVRDVNEDSGCHVHPGDPHLLGERGILTVVADGMGGHAAGEVASRIAIETISRSYYYGSGEPSAALRRAFMEANRRICEVAAGADNLRGMGTTCTALALCGERAFIAHVGDSRLYLLRNGRLYLLTEDHSIVMEMVRRGTLSREEARHHADRNVITRALGTNSNVDIYMPASPLTVRIGDIFMLCSDGLHDLVEDRELEQILVMTSTPYEASERLIALARARGGYDNITIGVVKLRPVNRSATERAPVTRETEAVE